MINLYKRNLIKNKIKQIQLVKTQSKSIYKIYNK